MSLFQTPETDPAEQAVLASIEGLRSQLGYLLNNSPTQWQGSLRRALIARGMRGSNSIEGYKVSVADAIAAMAEEEPLAASRSTWREILGYREAMTCVLRQVTDREHFRVSTDWIRALHYMMLKHEVAKNPGKWRPGGAYVHDTERNLNVYTGPHASLVPGLMEELQADIAELRNTPPLIRAAMAHLNLVMIHPFSDGNGRMARCLQTLVLGLSGTLAPEFSSIEEYLGKNTDSYYAVLAKVGNGSWNPDRDARPWIRFCLKAHLHQATTVLARSREQQKLALVLGADLQRRGLPERLYSALYDAAFNHQVRNGTYRNIADISAQVAQKDLALAVGAGYLTAYGDGRGRYYVATDTLQKLRRDTLEPQEFPDPFSDAVPTLE